jgi:hypothetical protein
MVNKEKIKLVIIFLLGLLIFVFLRFRPKPEIQFQFGLGFWEPFIILGLSFFLGFISLKIQKFLLNRFKGKELKNKNTKFSKILGKILDFYSAIIIFLYKIDHLWFVSFPISYFKWCQFCNISFMREYRLNKNPKKFKKFLGFLLRHREFIPFILTLLIDFYVQTWHFIYWGLTFYFVIKMLKKFRFYWSEMYFYFLELFGGDDGEDEETK